MEAHPYQTPSAPLEAESVFCRTCGSPIAPSAETCRHCNASQELNPKKKLTAALTALFLGGLGIHRFYLGQWWGVFYALLCITGIPIIIALIEAIVFLCTSDRRWKNKYGRTAGSKWVLAVVTTIAFVVLIGSFTVSLISTYQDMVEQYRDNHGELQQQR